ncbi:MAG: hypothetical protein KC619_35090 [Myxococcales bacterium]|nr:hypothetical protein [Myxococcales bacterium]
MRTRYAGPWAALALVALGGCGPTPREIGGLMIVGLAPAVWVAAALNYGLYRLWRRSREELAPPTKVEALVASGLALLFATITTIALGGAYTAEATLIAFWLVGTAYLTPMVVGIGIALGGRRHWAFRYLWWAPALVVFAVAQPLVLDVVGDTYVSTVLQTLMVLGGLGSVGGVLFSILLAFSLRAWVRARRAAAAPPGRVLSAPEDRGGRLVSSHACIPSRPHSRAVRSRRYFSPRTQ